MAEKPSKAVLRKGHVTGQHPHWTPGCDMCERHAARGRTSAVREFWLRLDSLRLERDDRNGERMDLPFKYRLLLMANHALLSAELIEAWERATYEEMGYRLIVQ